MKPPMDADERRSRLDEILVNFAAPKETVK